MKRWVGLPRGRMSDSNTTLKKTTPGEALEAQRIHQDGWPYGAPDNPKTRDTKGGKSGRPTGTLHTAATTWRQLRALEKDVATHEVLVSLDKPPTVKVSPKRKTQSEEGTSSPIVKATLNKDASGLEMTD